MRYLFEEYTFDTNLRELHRGAEVVAITPQVFDLLEYLIQNRERLLSKDDVMSAIWSGRVVSDSALTTRINAARSAIGDTGEKQRFIKTLPRKGFRFVGAVQEDGECAVAAAGSAAHSGTGTPIHISAPRLSIVVLPFANIGGDREQDDFVDGVTGSLTTDLSRIDGAFVIAHSTALAFKGRAIDITKLGHELKVRYVLEGAVQRGGNRLRVNVQLIDTETGAHLWADRFDKPLADLFDMQDEIVSRLANTLSAELIEAEARRAERWLHPSSMDLYFRGMALWNKGLTSEYAVQARDFFERALALDPGNVGAMVGAAMVDATVGAVYLTDERAAHLQAAEIKLSKALSRAPNHAVAHCALGAVLIWTNRAAQGIAECERALELDRNLANAHGMMGSAKIFMARCAETEGHINEALRLSPRDIHAYRWLMQAGFAKAHLTADADAVIRFRRSIEANRNYPIAHFALGGGLALLGSLDEARAAARAGFALDPSFTIRRFRLGASSDNPAYLANRERFYVGMRLAGIPEG